MDIKDLRTPEGKAKSEAWWENEKKKMERQEKRMRGVREKVWRGVDLWQPIKTCPFKLYEDSYGISGTLLVTDGKKIAVVGLEDRFGTPQICVKEPQQVLTDDGLALVGGEWKEPDWPKFMFDYEFQDQLEEHLEYGEPVQDEIDFIPTHWMPLPPPNPTSKD